ncbi:Uncharacterised protein [Collinsella intestinalis]|nr:Uncharacterised protein [Collinsella intestinalis]
MNEFDNTFHLDLERGKVGEQLVRQTFESLGYELKDVSDDSAFWVEDVDYLTADGIKYEVKTDYKLESTGNLALESEVYYKNYQELNDSWLWTSKADYFVFVNPHNTSCFYSIAAKDLRHLVKMENIRKYDKDEGYKITTLYLLPLWDYIDCFNIVETVD